MSDLGEYKYMSSRLDINIYCYYISRLDLGNHEKVENTMTALCAILEPIYRCVTVET